MIILKIGGNILNKPGALAEALDYFAALKGPAILVHGGGRKASEVIAAMGMEPKMIDGRRITDAACPLYTSDAADEPPCVDLGGRRTIKKKIYTSLSILITQHTSAC